MRRAEIITAGVLALFSVYLMWKSAELDVGYIRGEGPGGGAWPFWLAAVMLVCTGLIMLRAVRGQSVPAQSSEPLLDRYGKKMLLLVGGGLLGFIALIDIVSMYGAMFFFLVYYLKFLGRHTWRLTMVFAIVVPIAFFFFFEALMRITMPKGLPFLEPFFNFMNTIIY